MAPSMSIFSRRIKNSDQDKELRTALSGGPSPISTESGSSESHSSPAAQPLRSLNMLKSQKKISKAAPVAVPAYSPAFTPHLSRSRTADVNRFPPSPTSSNGHGLPQLSRSNSDISLKKGKLLDHKRSTARREFTPINSQSFLPQLVPLPTSPPPERSLPPTPKASFSPTSANRGVYTPPTTADLPISPPVSPESPLGVSTFGSRDHGRLRTENEYLQEISASKKLSGERDRITAKLDQGYNLDNINETLEPIPQHEDQIPYRHIRELECSKEAEISKYSSKISVLQQTHSQALKELKEKHSKEIALLKKSAKALENPHDLKLKDVENTERLKQRESELLGALAGKEKELDFLRIKNEGFREKCTLMENIMAGKSQELEKAKRMIKELKNEATTAHSSSDLETMLGQEEIRRNEIQRKAKANVEYILSEEGKLRDELNWSFGEKIQKLEALRKQDLEEFQTKVGKIHQEKAALEQRIMGLEMDLESEKRSSQTQKSGNDELIQMVKKMTLRLGEEKKRNRHLEGTISQISEEALKNVSSVGGHSTVMKRTIEDRDCRINYLEAEMRALKRDKDSLEDLWKKFQGESALLQQTVKDRDERIRDLEVESGGLRDSLEAFGNELSTLKQHSAAREEHFAKPSEDYSRGSTPSKDSGSEGSDEDLEGVKKDNKKLKADIVLYKNDIRGYRKDVKKRDLQISSLKKITKELELQLQKTVEPKAPQEALDAGSILEPKSSSTTTATTTTAKSSSSSHGPDDELAQLKKKLKLYEEEYRNTYEDRESLRKKHEALAGQQSMIIADMETQMAKLKKEKESVEHSTARQIKRMQQSFAQLSHAAVPTFPIAAQKYQGSPLPPLPIENPNNTMTKRSGSKKISNSDTSSGRRRTASLGGSATPAKSKEVLDIMPALKKSGEGPMDHGKSPVPSVRDRNTSDRERVDRTMSAVHEPDGALGEEVIEW